MPGGPGPRRDSHEGMVVVHLDGGCRGGLVEVGEERSDLREDRRRPAEGGERLDEGGVVGRVEQAPTHMQGDGRVPCHQRGGVEESGDLAEGAPTVRVGEPGEGPALVGQGQHLCHPALARPVSGQSDEGADHRSGDVSVSGDVTALPLTCLDGHRSSFNPSPRTPSAPPASSFHLRPTGPAP